MTFGLFSKFDRGMRYSFVSIRMRVLNTPTIYLMLLTPENNSFKSPHNVCKILIRLLITGLKITLAFNVILSNNN